jgi:hypothetical protein
MLKVNDVIRFRIVMRRPAIDEYRSARLSAVDFDPAKNSVNLTYVPCKLPDSVQCGFGCTFFTPQENPAHAVGKWGWQSIEVVGTEKPQPRFDPPCLFRNPGYDLVNM